MTILVITTLLMVSVLMLYRSSVETNMEIRYGEKFVENMVAHM